MIAIVFALKDEVRELFKWHPFEPLQGGGLPHFYESGEQEDLILVEGGVGKDRAEEATRRVIEEYNPRALVSVGFAGGVSPDMYPGELLLCHRLYSVTGPPALWSPKDVAEPVEVGESLLQTVTEALDEAGLRYRHTDCLSVTHLVSHIPLKRWIGANFQVGIIDMESYWVSKIASEHGIPSLAIRSVLDPLEVSLPSFVGQTVDAGGKGAWVRAARYVAARPDKIPSLIRLSTEAREARESLVEVLVHALPKLCERSTVLSGV